MDNANKDDIIFETDLDDITEHEKKEYYNMVQEANGGTLEGVRKISVISAEDNNVHLSYDKDSTVRFERIARITGYLSEVSNWNDGKRAELAERVKHA